MSMENCARHQEAHEAFNSRDMDACLGFMHEDCTWEDNGRKMSMTGHDEIRQWLQGWVDLANGQVSKPMYIDAGDYSVCMFSAAGTGPNGAIDGPFCEIAHWRGDKIDHAHIYYDQLQLLVNLGMMEAPAVAGV